MREAKRNLTTKGGMTEREGENLRRARKGAETVYVQTTKKKSNGRES